jgi:hypothetical protein
MEEKDSGSWRQRAAEARAEVAKMRDPVAQRMMLELASNYDALAEADERRLARSRRHL